jgi:hypothetical protein
LGESQHGALDAARRARGLGIERPDRRAVVGLQHCFPARGIAGRSAVAVGAVADRIGERHDDHAGQRGGDGHVQPARAGRRLAAVIGILVAHAGS